MQVQEKRFDTKRPSASASRTKREADLQRVKNQSEAAIHAVRRCSPQENESEWSRAAQSPRPGTKRPPRVASVQGMFQRLDCLAKPRAPGDSDGGRKNRAASDGRSFAGYHSAAGASKRSVCGAQKNARQVVVHYNAKPDAKLHTTGEVVAIEFH